MAQLVEHKTGDRRVVSSRLIVGGVTVLCPSTRHYPLLSTGSNQEDPSRHELLTGT